MESQDKLKSRWRGLRTTLVQTFINNVKYFKRVFDGKADEDTPKFLETGTQVHMYLFEEKEFKDKYIFIDYTKPRGENQLAFCEYFANQFKKDSKQNKKTLSVESYKNAYKTEKKSEDKITDEAVKLYHQLEDYIEFLTIGPDKEALTFSTLRYLKEAKESVKNHKLASSLIFENEFSTEEHYNETLIYWEFPLATIHNEFLVVKSTLDKLIIDHTNKIIKLVDLKTTNDMGEFPQRFADHTGYKIQLACYWFAVETFFRTNFPDKNIADYNRETYLVAIQTPNPYKDYPVNCEVWPISDQSLSEGLNIIEKTLPDIAWHFENDLWDHNRIYYEGKGAQKAL